MKGFCLTFYTYEFQKHHETLVYEWLLESARKHEIPGGIAIKAIAGYGHHKHLHEEHFFELASNTPVEVHFIVKKEESDLLLKLVKESKINLFYSLQETEYGYLNES